jgi:hypothetical protein
MAKNYNWIIDYWLIIVEGICGFLAIVFGYLGHETITILILVGGVILAAYKELRDKHKQRLDDAASELTDKKITEIRDMAKENKEELQYKQDIIKEFLKEGIVNEEDLLDNLNQEPFTILYHFNRGIDKEIIEFLPQKKKVVQNLLDELGFVPVGYRHGAYFFHVINTRYLPIQIQNVSSFEAYMRKRVKEIWDEFWENIKTKDPKLYAEYESKKDKKVNLSYFLGQIFPSNLSVGYLNFSSFDRKFLAYYAQFVDSQTIRINKQKLNELSNLASISFFVNSIEPNDRELILSNESTIKKSLGINKIMDYMTIQKEAWHDEISKIITDLDKANIYSEKIYKRAQKYCPIIKEFIG